MISTLEAPQTNLCELVNENTYGAVRDLKIKQTGAHVTVRGRCSTYHQKQLVTHAILSADPEITLRNEVVVGSVL